MCQALGAGSTNAKPHNVLHAGPQQLSCSYDLKRPTWLSQAQVQVSRMRASTGGVHAAIDPGAHGAHGAASFWGSMCSPCLCMLTAACLRLFLPCHGAELG